MSSTLKLKCWTHSPLSSSSSSSSSPASLPTRRRGRWRGRRCVRSSWSERLVHRSWSTSSCWRWAETPPDSITPVFSVKSCCLSSCRNCPIFMSSTRSWRLLSLRRQDRRARPSAWSVKTSSLSSAALWWISTSGSKRRWDLPTGFCENEKSTRDNVVIIRLLHEFPLYTLWSGLVRMGLMKMKTAVRGHRLSRRWVTLHLDSVEVWGHHLLKGLKHHWCTSCHWSESPSALICTFSIVVIISLSRERRCLLTACFVSSVLQQSWAPRLHQIQGLRTGSRGLCFKLLTLVLLIFS